MESRREGRSEKSTFQPKGTAAGKALRQESVRPGVGKPQTGYLWITYGAFTGTDGAEKLPERPMAFKL